MANKSGRIALCSGEPAGIGPDLCLQLAVQGFDCPVTVIGDPDMLQQRADLLGINIHVHAGNDAPHDAGHLHVMPVSVRAETKPGIPDPANAAYVLECLDVAIDGTVNRNYSAICTAPLHKGVINDAGIPFTGHTEYLAEKTGTPHVVMMLVADRLRVALATTHLPVREIAAAITEKSLRATLQVLHHDLQTRFGIARPRILVLGLNPHAGESGHLGREEIDIIAPLIRQLNKDGMNLVGPLPADTAFTPRWLKDADAVLAMYHDQGLPVLKYAGFGNAVNITLGLPFVRTSVDHGTAFELAGTGKASTSSLAAALRMAEMLTTS